MTLLGRLRPFGTLSEAPREVFPSEAPTCQWRPNAEFGKPRLRHMLKVKLKLKLRLELDKPSVAACIIVQFG